MRILFIVDCYYPSDKSSAKLVHDLAVEFRRRGELAVVLTPSDSIRDRVEVRVEEGITVVRVKNGRIKGANKVLRAMREARLSTTMWSGAKEILRQNPCDLIVFYSPTIFFGRLVRKLKKLWDCPAYLILRDIFPDWAVDARIIRKGLIYEYFRRTATRQYGTADIIAVQSPRNMQYFASSFPRDSFCVEVLVNWASLKEEGLSKTSYRERLGLQDKTVFLYGGNIGVAQDMGNILRLAARLAPRRDIHILLVGDGSEAPRLKKIIEERHLKNVQLISGLSQQDYLSVVSEFDIGLISLDARLTTHNIPGKLLSYLYWGIPVLASVNPGNDLIEIIEGSHAGFCIVNGDDDKLLQAALRLADDHELRKAMRINARRLFERNFSVERAADNIMSHLSAISWPARRSKQKVAVPMTPRSGSLGIPEQQ